MNLYIPANLANQLKTLAEKDRRSVSGYLRLMIEKALTQPINQNTQCN